MRPRHALLVLLIALAAAAGGMGQTAPATAPAAAPRPAAPASADPAPVPADPAPVPVPAAPGRRAADNGRPVPPRSDPLKPFVAFSWSFAGHGLPHVKPMVWFGRGANPALVARSMSAMEPGTRVVLNAEGTIGLAAHPGDVCVDATGAPTTQPGLWPNRGAEAAQDLWDSQLRRFALAGGAIDFLALDYEAGLGELGSEDRLRAIGADPRWPEVAREWGFNDPLLYLFKNERGESVNRFNAVVMRQVDAALTKAMFDPLRRRFPGAGMSNFAAIAASPEEAVPWLNGRPAYALADPAGTHVGFVAYGPMPWFLNPPADFRRPFAMIVYTVNDLRANVRSTRMPIFPWLAGRSLTKTSVAHPWGNTDWWEEAVYHVLLSGGTSNAMFFNPPTGKDIKAAGERQRDNAAMEAAMAEVERQAGGSPVVATVDAAKVPWGATSLASAARLADGSVLVRVTFAEGVSAAEVTVLNTRWTARRPPDKLGVWMHLPGR